MADVQVTIGASIRDLQEGLNKAGKLIGDFKGEASKAREAAQFFARAITGIGGASEQAGAVMANLFGRVRLWRRDGARGGRGQRADCGSYGREEGGSGSPRRSSTRTWPTP